MIYVYRFVETVVSGSMELVVIMLYLKTTQSLANSSGLVTVQIFTDLNSTFAIQNGVLIFNRDQSLKNLELSLGYFLRHMKINMVIAYSGLIMISDETL
jgi:hypothetical protein